MKNSLSFFVLFFVLSTVVYSQKLSDQLVYETIINHYDSLYPLTFYTKDVVFKNTSIYKGKMKDTFEVFDVESYETSFQTGMQISAFQDSINILEAVLFKERTNFPNGLYMIHSLPKHSLHKQLNLNEYIDLEKYPDPKLLDEVSFEFKDRARLGEHEIRMFTESNKKKYKYAIKAYCSFSNVVWDLKGKYCIVESGISYTIQSGRTGMGFLFLIEQKEEELKILQLIPLWQE